MIDNFIRFRPLGMVLVTAMGIGLAEESGLLRTALQSSIVKAPPYLITAIVVFSGIMGNLASSASFVDVYKRQFLHSKLQEFEFLRKILGQFPQLAE